MGEQGYTPYKNDLNIIIAENVKKNWNYILYSIRHKMVVQRLVKEKFGKGLSSLEKNLIKRVEYHDMDKVFSYFFLEKTVAPKLHRQTSSHHMENNLPKTDEDYFEAIFDYESAGYTKPDKPLNAYDTLMKYFPLLEKDETQKQKDMKILLHFMDLLDFNKSYNVLDLPISYEMRRIMDMEITKDIVFSEIKKYITHNKLQKYLLLMEDVKKLV